MMAVSDVGLVGLSCETKSSSQGWRTLFLKCLATLLQDEPYRRSIIASMTERRVFRI